MHRGYIKDWRKSLDNPLYKKPLIWHFWGYCLKKANHKKSDVFINGQIVNVEKGSFVFGRKIASEETGLSEQQIRTAIKYLEKLQNLTIKSTNKYSIISIINWDVYQQPDLEINQQNNQVSTSNQPAINQQSTTNKNDNNYKNYKKEEKNIYSPNFLKFWELYPKKTGKGAAFQAYKKIKEPRPSLQQIELAIKNQNKTEQWQSLQFIPNPATWLNQRRWEDEIEAKQQTVIRKINSRSDQNKEACVNFIKSMMEEPDYEEQ